MSRLSSGEEPHRPDPVAIAACALLLEIAHADDVFAPEERERIVRAVREDLGVPAGDVEEVVRLAEEERRESVDLYQFTKLVAEKFSRAQRLRLVEVIWGVVYADGQLTAVNVATLDGAEKKIPADVLLPFFGLSMSLGPIAEWGLALERNQIAVDPATAATNLAGIFAVGDVVHYPGKLKLILTGFAESAIAARSAYALVHPETPLHFEYSTTAGVPSA